MGGNPGDTGSIIGRDAELAQIDEVLASDQPQFVLLVGAQGIGKGRLLSAVRTRAERAGRVVLPAQPDDPSAPWLVIDKSTTVEAFDAVAGLPKPESGFDEDRSRRPPGASGEYRTLPPTDGTHHLPLGARPPVVLIHGYWPDEMFSRWFTAEFAGRRAEQAASKTIIVAATDAEAEPLLRHRGLVDLVVPIEPLPVATMLAELNAINDRISDPLTEREHDIYSQALAVNPGLLDSFQQLLPLTGKLDDEAS